MAALRRGARLGSFCERLLDLVSSGLLLGIGLSMGMDAVPLWTLGFCKRIRLAVAAGWLAWLVERAASGARASGIPSSGAAEGSHRHCCAEPKNPKCAKQVAAGRASTPRF